MLTPAGNVDDAAAAEELLHAWDSPWRPASPKRLSDITHELANRALSGEHGRAMKNAGSWQGPLKEDLTVSERPAGVSPDRAYAQATMRVAQVAPLRILPGEQVVGSATLREAPAHMTPLADVRSTSHTTIGFHRVLGTGYRGLREQIRERLARGDLDEKGADLLESMKICLDAAAVWHKRHLDLLDRLASAGATPEEREAYRSVRRALERVPEEPPQSFREAVQSLWFMYAFQRLMGNWSGIGRIDEMLGPYLERDLAAKRITLDEARELLAHFWVKGCEWIGARGERGSGDAQHYQNIVLSGIDKNGCDVTNAVTYLVLDVVEELHISDFPVAVRLNSHTPRKLLRRIAEVQRHGGGIVALYNEEVVIEGLVRFGYPLEEARSFANDGCWETIVPGRTAFTYRPFDLLSLLQETLGLHDPAKPVAGFADFDSLYASFLADLETCIDSHHAVADRAWSNGHPAPLLSLFVEDCIERGRGYYDRGARYNVLAPHAGGMANVGNSLLAIRKLVYEERRFTLSEFVEILRNDWEGRERLRQEVLRRIGSYGNDHRDADDMTERVFNDYTGIVARVRERKGVLRPAGISTFGREIAWRHPNGDRKATPDGHRIGETLATNFSPSPGTDRNGPTAVLKSYCRMDFTRAPNCATVELKVHPENARGERGILGLVALMRSFVRLGGVFLHVDVVDAEVLRDAQRHPEKYPNLSVRIAGWSARFATLNETWQNMIIGRTQQVL